MLALGWTELWTLGQRTLRDGPASAAKPLHPARARQHYFWWRASEDSELFRTESVQRTGQPPSQARARDSWFITLAGPAGRTKTNQQSLHFSTLFYTCIDKMGSCSLLHSLFCSCAAYSFSSAPRFAHGIPAPPSGIIGTNTSGKIFQFVLVFTGKPSGLAHTFSPASPGARWRLVTALPAALGFALLPYPSRPGTLLPTLLLSIPLHSRVSDSLAAGPLWIHDAVASAHDGCTTLYIPPCPSPDSLQVRSTPHSMDNVYG